MGSPAGDATACEGGMQELADLVRFDEQRRKKSRRRQILKQVETTLGRFERGMASGRPEFAAAELVTLGRQLVRLLEAFDELSGAAGPLPADADAQQAAGALSQAAEAQAAYEANSTVPSQPSGGRQRAPAAEATGAPATEAAGTPAEQGRPQLRVLHGRGGAEHAPREMSPSQFWEMIALALEEIVDTLESFTAHLALLLSRRASAGLQGASGPATGSKSVSRRASGQGRPKGHRDGRAGRAGQAGQLPQDGGSSLPKKGGGPPRRRDEPR